MRLQISLRGTQIDERFAKLLARAPELSGEPIHVEFKPQLRAYRGKLVLGDHQKGVPVYAATFIRQRKIVLESGLLKIKTTLRHILLHELFHFVWVRLGNQDRHQFEQILRNELRSGARGELGESAGVKKSEWLDKKPSTAATGRWKDYVCESFCDSAAWLYAGEPSGGNYTLGKKWRSQRRSWFQATFVNSGRC